MEELYQKYENKGLVILAFPCNQFSNQEPLSNAEIKSTYPREYNVTYPIFEKINVNGDNEDSLYSYLKKEQGGILGTKKIKWNFTKFLVDRNGNVVERYAPKTKPKNFEDKIKDLL